MLGRLDRYGGRALILAALATTATPAHAQAMVDRLSIHGYLTQGCATTSGPTILRIPNDGTFDYRRAALLVRFRGSPNDAFVVQIANRRRGKPRQ